MHDRAEKLSFIEPQAFPRSKRATNAALLGMCEGLLSWSQRKPGGAESVETLPATLESYVQSPDGRVEPLEFPAEHLTKLRAGGPPANDGQRGFQLDVVVGLRQRRHRPCRLDAWNDKGPGVDTENTGQFADNGQ